MAFALLGDTHRVIYETKNFKTGVAGITATVTKPNGTTLGPFMLIEFPNHPGLYYFDLGSALSDPEGDWAGVVIEGTHKSAFKCTFRNPDDFGGEGGGGGTTTVVGGCDPLQVELGAISKPFCVEIQKREPLEVNIQTPTPLLIELQSNATLNVEVMSKPTLQVELGVCDESK